MERQTAARFVVLQVLRVALPIDVTGQSALAESSMRDCRKGGARRAKPLSQNRKRWQNRAQTMFPLRRCPRGYSSARLRHQPTADFVLIQHRQRRPQLRQPHRQPTTTTVKMSTAELASSYAALILADDGIEITVSRTALNCRVAGR